MKIWRRKRGKEAPKNPDPKDLEIERAKRKADDLTRRARTIVVDNHLADRVRRALQA